MCVCLEGTHCVPNLHGPPEAPWAADQLPNSLTPYNSAVHPSWQLHAHTHTHTHTHTHGCTPTFLHLSPKFGGHQPQS